MKSNLKNQSSTFTIKIIFIFITTIILYLVLQDLTDLKSTKLANTIPTVVLLSYFLLFFYPSLTRLIQNPSYLKNTFKIRFLFIIVSFLGFMSIFEWFYVSNYLTIIFVIAFAAFVSIFIIESAGENHLDIIFIPIFLVTSFITFILYTSSKLDTAILILNSVTNLILLIIHQIFVIKMYEKTTQIDFEKKKIGFSFETLKFIIRKIIYGEFVLFLIPSLLNITLKIDKILVRNEFYSIVNFLLFIAVLTVIVLGIFFLPIKNEDSYFNPEKARF